MILAITESAVFVPDFKNAKLYSLGINERIIGHRILNRMVINTNNLTKGELGGCFTVQCHPSQTYVL